MAQQHVLIVDDRPTNRTVFAKLAQTLDVDVAVRTSGDPREALRMLEGYTPDLIIVDYSMPEMNGAEFTRAVRARSATHEVPIVVITAYDDRDFRLSALEAGASDFLQSPVDRREFQQRARAMLAFRRQQLSVRDRAQLIEETGAGSTAALASLVGPVLDTLPILVTATDRKGNRLFVNARQAAIFGTNPADLVGADMAALYEDVRGARERELNEAVLKSEHAIPDFEDVVRQDGIDLVFLTSKAPLRDGEGRIVGVLTSAVDITGRKRAETHLNHIARHDTLTGLPNRVMFRDRVQQSIGRAREAGQGLAVLLLDLDRFKFINDSRGHRVGDRLLEQVAARVAGALAPDDFVARLGGDEFAIVLADVADAGDAADRATRLLAAVACTYALDEHELALSASLGISLFPDDRATPDELLRTADLAMYEAKAQGGNLFRFFHDDMNRRAQDAATLEADLHAAIEREEFELFYQPLMSARGGTLAGAEALIRWNHPQRGLLSPGDFLKLAEETGLVIPIGTWVLRAACRQAVAWAAAGTGIPRISVNLSPLQFQRQDVLGLVRDTIAETGIEPGMLQLEIVESTLVRNRAMVADTLRQLRALGVRIAIDDFGTGYSSLQYLRDLPVDCLKIDRSFVSGLPASTKDAAIVHALTSMAHDLGLDIVAEGIETEEQRIMLRAIGCDSLQGYHLGRPCPAAAFARLLAAAEPGRAGIAG